MFHLKSALFLPFAFMCASACLAQDTALATEKGMLVTRDAESGRLRAPTAAESLLLKQQHQQQRSQRSSARMVASRPALVVGPGGRRSVRLGESHLVYSVVTRDKAGKLVEQCVDGAHAADGLAIRPAGAAGPEEHEHEGR